MYTKCLGLRGDDINYQYWLGRRNQVRKLGFEERAGFRILLLETIHGLSSSTIPPFISHFQGKLQRVGQTGWKLCSLSSCTRCLWVRPVSLLVAPILYVE